MRVIPINKSSRFTRRMDDLGRILIPKKIRDTAGILFGEEIDIFSGPNGEIIMKKHLPMQEQTDHGNTSL